MIIIYINIYFLIILKMWWIEWGDKKYPIQERWIWLSSFDSRNSKTKAWKPVDNLLYHSWESFYNEKKVFELEKPMSKYFHDTWLPFARKYRNVDKKVVTNMPSEMDENWSYIGIKIEWRVDKDPITSNVLKKKIDDQFVIVDKIASMILSKDQYAKLLDVTVNSKNFDSIYNAKLCFMRMIETCFGCYPYSDFYKRSISFATRDCHNYSEILSALQKEELRRLKDAISRGGKWSTWKPLSSGIPTINFDFDAKQQPKNSLEDKQERRKTRRDIIWHRYAITLPGGKQVIDSDIKWEKLPYKEIAWGVKQKIVDPGYIIGKQRNKNI